MVRSLFSGVSGLRSHQTRMDVIGNNISNVNTNGFKGSRVTFKDIYYQTTKNPSAGTDFSGGVNPSQVGYGSQVGSIDANMNRSSFQMTESGLDFAIAGEGFFQIQDAAGNLMYTRAGNFTIDPKGNLVDSKGNFVLGTPAFTDANGNVTGLDAPPSNSRLTMQIPDSQDKSGQAIKSLLGTDVKLSVSGNGPDGNISVSFQQVQGQSPYASMSGSSVSIYLDLNKQFGSLTDLQAEIDKALANSNIPATHPVRASGGLKIEATPPAGYAAGATLASGQINATISNTTAIPGIAASATSTSTAGAAVTNIGWSVTDKLAAPAPPNAISVTFATSAVGTPASAAWAGNAFTITLEPNQSYTDAQINALITAAAANAPTGAGGLKATFTGTIATADTKTVATLTGGANPIASVPIVPPKVLNVKMDATAPGSASNAYKTVFTKGTGALPIASWNGNTLMVALSDQPGANTKAAIDAAIVLAAGTGADAPAKTLQVNANIIDADIDGVVEYSKNGIYMNGGQNTFFTDVAKLLGIAKLDGGSFAGPQSMADITNLAVGKDGVIVATHPVVGQMVLGRIDLSVFDNTNGLMQLGDSYFGETVNSGEAKIMSPDSESAGALVSNSLEMSNVDLSKEFSDMIVTQRGFQANSRIITVSDEMLQELVNLKR